jgi:hypothetical protein
MADKGIELRAFIHIDQLQKQFVSFIGTTAFGFFPLAGQSALFLEIAPGLEINTLMDLLMKQANVMPGAMVVERVYGMLEVHADSPADVKLAGEVILDFLGLEESDRQKPKILGAEVIERADAQMTQIMNRFRNCSMPLADETVYVIEVEPAAYAGYVANEVEKVCDVKLVHVTIFGASGRVYMSGTSSNIATAKVAAEEALANLTGRG